MTVINFIKRQAKSPKVISLKKVIIDEVLKYWLETLETVEEDYEIPVKVEKEELLIVLKYFYDYYEDKQLVYDFREQMINHMEDIIVTAIDIEHQIDIEFILDYLKIFELFDSSLAIIPSETKKVVEKIKQKIKKGRE